MTRVRPATVRYYFDADVRGLGMVLAQVRPDVTYPGDVGGELHKRQRPACAIEKVATLDEDWIPVIAQQGLLIITRDAHIQDHRLQIAAVRDNSARMVALAGKAAGNTWAQLLLVTRLWPEIEALEGRQGPFILNANPGGLSPVDLS